MILNHVFRQLINVNSQSFGHPFIGTARLRLVYTKLCKNRQYPGYPKLCCSRQLLADTYFKAIWWYETKVVDGTWSNRQLYFSCTNENIRFKTNFRIGALRRVILHKLDLICGTLLRGNCMQFVGIWNILIFICGAAANLRTSDISRIFYGGLRSR